MPRTVEWKESEELDFILEHEYIHIRWLDAAAKLILTVAFCVHWFNPLVWGVYALAERDMELACDEGGAPVWRGGRKALCPDADRHGGKKELFRAAGRNFGKNALEERIIAIMRSGRHSIPGSCLALCLGLGLGLFFTAPVPVSGSGAALDDGRRIQSVAGQISDAEEERTDGIDVCTGFTREDYDRLLTLLFVNCENMTVAAYQERVWKMIDTPEWQELPDRFSRSDEFYEKRKEDDAAAFFFDLLEPLTAERWQTRGFGGDGFSGGLGSGHAGILAGDDDPEPGGAYGGRI